MDVLAFELELQRHLEQPRGARIARVKAVAEAGRRAAAAAAQSSTSCSAASCSESPARTSVRPLIEKAHARLDVAAVMRAEREDAGGHAVLERRARGRDVARRQRRRRRDAVIERRDQDGVQHPADRRRRQLAHQQQIDGVGERQPSHHLVEGVAADQDRVRRDRRQRRSASGRPAFAGLRAALVVECVGDFARAMARLRECDRLQRCRRGDRRSRRGRARCTCARSAR